MIWVKGELLDSIDRVGDGAGAMLNRKHQSHLFDRISWFKRVWTHTAPGQSPLVARALSERTHGWLFLVKTGNSRATALVNWYSLAFRPVFHGDGDDGHKVRLLTAMARRLRPGLSQIELSPVPEDDGSCDLIVRAFRRAGWASFVSKATVRWTIQVAEQSFEAYWAARPGVLRSTYSRRCAKAPITVTLYDRFDGDAWDAYETVYNDSWKPEEGAPAFLREMAETEGKAGCLRLAIGCIDGEPVAAQLWTVENSVAIIHKLAHRDMAAEHSPGTLLTHALFRHVIDVDKVALVDFGTGNDPYKADWMDHCEPLHRIQLFNMRSPSGIVGAAKARLSALVRRDNSD
jgi:Acetyltransferase (GNAT) domain